MEIKISADKFKKTVTNNLLSPEAFAVEMEKIEKQNQAKEQLTAGNYQVMERIKRNLEGKKGVETTKPEVQPKLDPKVVNVLKNREKS